MVNVKYPDSQHHEKERAKSKHYYCPITKSLRYFSKKLKLSKPQIMERFGENVYTNKEVMAHARDTLRYEIKKQQLETNMKEQLETYEKYYMTKVN